MKRSKHISILFGVLLMHPNAERHFGGQQSGSGFEIQAANGNVQFVFVLADQFSK